MTASPCVRELVVEVMVKGYELPSPVVAKGVDSTEGVEDGTLVWNCISVIT